MGGDECAPTQLSPEVTRDVADILEAMFGTPDAPKMPALEGVELAEARLEGQRGEEAGQQLYAGLADPQLLEDVVPVAVAALVGRLVPPVRRVDIAVATAGSRVGRVGCGAAGIGGGLTFAAVSNTCAMGMMLAKLPYNRGAVCDVQSIVAQLVASR